MFSFVGVRFSPIACLAEDARDLRADLESPSRPMTFATSGYIESALAYLNLVITELDAAAEIESDLDLD